MLSAFLQSQVLDQEKTGSCWLYTCVDYLAFCNYCEGKLVGEDFRIKHALGFINYITTTNRYATFDPTLLTVTDDSGCDDDQFIKVFTDGYGKPMQEISFETRKTFPNNLPFLVSFTFRGYEWKTLRKFYDKKIIQSKEFQEEKRKLCLHEKSSTKKMMRRTGHLVWGMFEGKYFYLKNTWNTDVFDEGFMVLDSLDIFRDLKVYFYPLLVQNQFNQPISSCELSHFPKIMEFACSNYVLTVENFKKFIKSPEAAEKVHTFNGKTMHDFLIEHLKHQKRSKHSR